LTCVGTVTKSGSRVAFTEGVVTDRAGKIVATASSTLLLFAPDSPADASQNG
jgi:acyl-coenzyme A thioesterase PaaI-like protein